MLMKSMTAGLLGTALLATSAFAQTTTAPATSPSATSSSMTTSSTSPSSFHGDWRTSKMIGLNVYNSSNEKLGDINELLTDQNGKIAAVVIGVGGFLGVGERDVAIPFDKVKFVNEPVRTSSSTTSTNSNTANNTTATRPAPTTTTTGAAVGATAPMNNNSATMSANRNEWYPDHAMVSASKDELKSMPEFKYDTNNK